MKYTALTIPGSSPHVINSTQTPNLHTLLPRFETLLSPTAPRLHHQATTPELLGYRTSHSLLDNDSRAVPVSDPLANHPHNMRHTAKIGASTTSLGPLHPQSFGESSFPNSYHIERSKVRRYSDTPAHFWSIIVSKQLPHGKKQSQSPLHGQCP